VRFRDVTRAASIRFALGHHGRHPLTILETTGCGGAFLDADRDGRLDLFLVGQSTRSPEPPCALYHNEGNGTFVDVTRAAGLDPPGTWMGCAVGDYDNDGYPDLLLTGYGDLCLLHNEASAGGAHRRFVDVTRAMGLRAAPADWFTSAGWADVDRDGYLDLYVARYVTFDAHTPQFCRLGLDPQGRAVRGTCGPELYAAQRGLFYHNRQGRHLEEATERNGFGDAHGKGLGVAFGDFDGDGWPDLYIANDQMPADLYRNRSGRRFVNVAIELGTAYSGDSRPQSGMGVDWGDYDRDGRLDLIVTTFFQERKSLYRNEGPAGFREVSDEVGLTPAIPHVSWGNRWFDADNDGQLDWVVASGHAEDNMAQVDPAQPYAQPALLFRNEEELFREISAAACASLARPMAGRGIAAGDYDNDGRTDLLITNNDGEPLLLHNESATGNHWLRVALAGRLSNRDAAGARVWVTTGRRVRRRTPAGGRPGGRPIDIGSPGATTQMRDVTTGGSYLSASDPRLLFGLGAATQVMRLRVRWPSGITTTLTNLTADHEVTLRE
jgi:enediyne biosynthesis protein E4